MVFRDIVHHLYLAWLVSAWILIPLRRTGEQFVAFSGQYKPDKKEKVMNYVSEYTLIEKLKLYENFMKVPLRRTGEEILQGRNDIPYENFLILY
jgi:hypothetical protein